MAGTVIENLSGRKLTIIVGCLLFAQLICFLIGGLMSPIPSSVQTILATICADVPGAFNDTNIWLYSRGEGNCNQIPTHSLDELDVRMTNQMVYVFQMPLPRGGSVLDYSRWQQNLIGVLQMDITMLLDSELTSRNMMLTFDARLAYRNKGDPETKWTYMASSLEHRNLECHYMDDVHDEEDLSTGKKKTFQQHQHCNPLVLFELGSLHHDYYLINIRIPIDSEKKYNLHLNEISRIGEMNMATIYQNGGFTKIWFSMKLFFFPFIVAIMIWFWRRVHILQRSPALLEYMLIYLGAALTLLNLPLEYLTLVFDMPFMLLLSDIRQGVFYAMLLSFWLIFAGEHMLVQDNGEKNTIRIYWKHLSAVVVGCVSLFIFDMCERGVKLRNPFYSIWVSKAGTNFALTFIILAGISAGIYFLFLCYMIWRVFCNISLKRTSLPAMSQARRLHYEGIIYRFKFLMLATLVCAGLTVAGFVMGQMSEGQFRWEDEDMDIELTSAFLTGVYGMWNIYIFCLLILYAPSHKQWPSNSQAGNGSGSGDNNSENNAIVSEEIEFSSLPSDYASPSEISSLTSFARKAAYD